MNLIGNTPLVRLTEFEKINATRANIYAKLEYHNAFGSIKDRAALNVITTAEKIGRLGQDSCIIEATSGNMGIALAGIARHKGYLCKIVMPEDMAKNTTETVEKYNAKVILTPTKLGMQGAIEKSKSIAKALTNSFYADQFNNWSCVEAHKLFTAPEIQKDLCGGNVDLIVAGIGSGATVRGLSEYFKIQSSKAQIVGILPSSNDHTIQGIGAGFIPPFLNGRILDAILRISDTEAYQEKENIYMSDGLFVGPSSGAVIAGLKKILNEKDYTNQNIVLIFADGGARYKNDL